MLHTYSVAPNASKWRYILFSLLGWNFFLEFATFWTPNDYHCSKGVHIAAEYVFFLSSFQTSYLIMTISQRIQEHEESLLSSAGNKPLSILYTYMHTRLYINNMVCPWLSSLLKLVISGFSKGEYEDDEVVSDAINDPMGFFGAAGKSTLQSPWQLPSPRCDSVALGSMWGHKTMIECNFSQNLQETIDFP